MLGEPGIRGAAETSGFTSGWRGFCFATGAGFFSSLAAFAGADVPLGLSTFLAGALALAESLGSALLATFFGGDFLAAFFGAAFLVTSFLAGAFLGAGFLAAAFGPFFVAWFFFG